jgi:hypothetical protein
MKYLLVLCCAISISTVAEVPSDAVQFKLKRISDGDTGRYHRTHPYSSLGLLIQPERDQSLWL